MTTPTTPPQTATATPPSRQTPDQRRQRIADAIAGYMTTHAGKLERPRRTRWARRTAP